MRRLLQVTLMSALCAPSIAAQLRVVVHDSAGVALLGARVELWSGATLIVVRTTDPEGVAAFTPAEAERASDALVRNIGFAQRRVRVAGTSADVVVRLDRLAQSLPAVTIAAALQSCPQEDDPRARELYRNVAARYGEPSFEGRATTFDQREGTVEERDVGFFYESELRGGDRFFTPGGMQGGLQRLARRDYVYVLDGTHNFELFGAWRYPAIEAELAGHFATEDFAAAHAFKEISRTATGITPRFCARDRRGSGLDGTLLLSERDGFVEVRWRFWNARSSAEQAGGAATFASVGTDDPARLTSTGGLFWRRLPSGRFVQRWQRFHEWRFFGDGSDDERALTSTCLPVENYVVCSANTVQTGGGASRSACQAQPYSCHD